MVAFVDGAVTMRVMRQQRAAHDASIGLWQRGDEVERAKQTAETSRFLKHFESLNATLFRSGYYRINMSHIPQRIKKWRDTNKRLQLVLCGQYLSKAESSSRTRGRR